MVDSDVEVDDAPRGMTVAVVGSGPSAFYAAEALIKTKGLGLRVDMFDRLPTPYGLVRGGVAPDHQKIKNVVRVYEKIAADPRYRFFGNVMLGRDLSVDDLKTCYSRIIYAVGNESDRRLGCPGEELEGVHAATDFVGWYNGHPDHQGHRFGLQRAERAVVIGNGNVAIDVARLLARRPEELAPTDIAEDALASLRGSSVKEVVLIGRRGPAQAAFSPKEIKELDELDGVEVVVDPADAALDALSADWLEASAPRSAKRNVAFLQELAARGTSGSGVRCRVLCRFLLTPKQMLAADDGSVGGVQVERGELVADEHGTPRPRGTGAVEDISADLVFKAVGYRGVPIEGVPFDDARGTVPNAEGRVLAAPGGAPREGEYVVGWAKRGPTGLIGTNSPDSKETVAALLEDVAQDERPRRAWPDVQALLEERGVDYVTLDDWRRLDAWESERGAARGKVRSKLTCVEDMMRVVHELRAGAGSSTPRPGEAGQ